MEILVSIEESSIHITKVLDSRIARQKHGLTRSLINNMIIGVSEKFNRQLQMVGVGKLNAKHHEKEAQRAVGKSNEPTYVANAQLSGEWNTLGSEQQN